MVPPLETEVWGMGGNCLFLGYSGYHVDYFSISVFSPDLSFSRSIKFDVVAFTNNFDVFFRTRREDNYWESSPTITLSGFSTFNDSLFNLANQDSLWSMLGIGPSQRPSSPSDISDYGKWPTLARFTSPFLWAEESGGVVNVYAFGFYEAEYEIGSLRVLQGRSYSTAVKMVYPMVIKFVFNKTGTRPHEVSFSGYEIRTEGVDRLGLGIVQSWTPDVTIDVPNSPASFVKREGNLLTLSSSVFTYYSPKWPEEPGFVEDSVVEVQYLETTFDIESKSIVSTTKEVFPLGKAWIEERVSWRKQFIEKIVEGGLTIREVEDRNLFPSSFWGTYLPQAKAVKTEKSLVFLVQNTGWLGVSTQDWKYAEVVMEPTLKYVIDLQTKSLVYETGRYNSMPDPDVAASEAIRVFGNERSYYSVQSSEFFVPLAYTFTTQYSMPSFHQYYENDRYLFLSYHGHVGVSEYPAPNVSGFSDIDEAYSPAPLLVIDKQAKKERFLVMEDRLLVEDTGGEDEEYDAYIRNLVMERWKAKENVLVKISAQDEYFAKAIKDNMGSRLYPYYGPNVTCFSGGNGCFLLAFTGHMESFLYGFRDYNTGAVLLPVTAPFKARDIEATIEQSQATGNPARIVLSLSWEGGYYIDSDYYDNSPRLVFNHETGAVGAYVTPVESAVTPVESA